ncbi:hypothetical protein UFOVP602_20 [uncultured Caudovirales phage]|uniref:Uncharacterized protein n=1 Tax=uncultured Caudovirales phage TaxID=2100421 RepID=A0A6J5N3X5_9CAUD|nr:hypothetical protein UFOVP602_20 [uncultured Caudovirales phage]
MSKQVYIIAAKNEAFGTEGASTYVGTERGARRTANKIARAAGHGWSAIVHHWAEDRTPAV